MASFCFKWLVIVLVVLCGVRAIVEGRTLHRQHRRDHESNVQDAISRKDSAEEEAEDLTRRLSSEVEEVDRERQDSSDGQEPRHHHHHRHHHHQRPQHRENDQSSRLVVDWDRSEDVGTNPSASRVASEPRRKRHNGIHANVRYRKMNDHDRREYRGHAPGIARNKRYDDHFELEVKAAQNSSICNYTVVPIPDARGNRVQRDLEHVMCNHVGSRCQSVGQYCCIQTYRYVDVAYADDYVEKMKIYAGCVCSLQTYDELEETTIPIND